MQCPECNSTQIHKNGKRRGKQNHICVDCRRQFIEDYASAQGYSDEVKRDCLKMYVNGMGFGGIERVKGVHHTTVIYWLKQVGANLPDAYQPDRIPEVGELDELETFVGFEKNKIWLWTAVDHFRPGILAWVLGDHSGETFQPLRAIVGAGKCYFYVTDGWSVYPGLIADGDQIVSKTYMTRVEGENTRLRHYLARLHRKTLCYSNSEEMLRHSIRLLLHYLRFWDVPVPQ
ncbi:IS1 family transposase [Chroococcidiopsis sp. CCMEE 29]|uniref:IS1 family transposase n=1 Tax=Chroococcidiopsis sp. CCMEE 29 TaxID=155894 RepID=UPI0031F8DEC5